jgi:hypothetical protein
MIAMTAVAAMIRASSIFDIRAVKVTIEADGQGVSEKAKARRHTPHSAQVQFYMHISGRFFMPGGSAQIDLARSSLKASDP